MSESDSGQVTRSAAEVYEEFFVPALFLPWAGRTIETAQIQVGEEVLDVACGTGVVTRIAAEHVAPTGSVTGVDPNEGMLATAARKAPNIHWCKGRAEELPFESDRFDVVVCQFGLMFFEDPVAGLDEMLRVLRPGGRLVVAVWGSIESAPGYARLADLLQRLFGSNSANALRAPFKLGDAQLLASLFAKAGIAHSEISEHEDMALFPSLQAWLFTEIKGWVLADVLSSTDFDRLLAEAQVALSSFVSPSGRVEFPTRAYIVSVTKAS